MTIQFVAATAFSLLLLVVVANVMVNLYQRGAVRDALDEGVRAASVVDHGDNACARKANEVLAVLAPGVRLGNDGVTCSRSRYLITARADVHFESWLPLVPSWTSHLKAMTRITGVP